MYISTSYILAYGDIIILTKGKTMRVFSASSLPLTQPDILFQFQFIFLRESVNKNGNRFSLATILCIVIH